MIFGTQKESYVLSQVCNTPMHPLCVCITLYTLVKFAASSHKFSGVYTITSLLGHDMICLLPTYGSMGECSLIGWCVVGGALR